MLALRERLIDLAAKWKHGWIPLNAEAVAILESKAEHGKHLSHQQMLAMPHSEVKKHYSDTIKLHGFQHPYTKKVGKVVGSHPEALAATKAKKAANQAKAAGMPSPSAPAVPEPPKAPEAPTLPPDPPTGILEKVHSVSGEHIGFLAKGKGTGGKAHMVFDKQGNVVGNVNSFTGAQHVLGETKLGKPKAPHEVGGVVKEHQHLLDAPVGTKMHWTGPSGTVRDFTKIEGGHWENDQGVVLTSDEFKGAVNNSKLNWGAAPTPAPKPTLPAKIGEYHTDPQGDGTWGVHDSETNWIGTVVASEDGKSFAAMTPSPMDDGSSDQLSVHPTPEAAVKALISHHAPPSAPKPKPEKIEPDPPLPEQPKGMADGWAVQDAQSLADAPIGTWVSNGNGIAYKKYEDGAWKRYYQSGGEWTASVGLGQSDHQVFNAYGGMHWGDKGPNSEPPAGYTGPRYGLVEHGGNWAVKDYYSGTIVPGTLSAGKPNASKKVNDLNKKAGTLSAAQKKAEAKKAVTTQALNEAFIASAGGVAPHELGHPTVPIGATDEHLLGLTFDASKTGELHALASAESTTPNDHLFGQWGGSSVSAKKHTAARISERMAKHYGLDDQAKLDDAWTAAAKAGMVTHSGGSIGSFHGNSNDAYSAVPLPDDGGDIKRGTPEFNQLMREKMVAHMIQLWAQSSNDDHPVTLTLQDIAGHMFGVSDQAAWSSASGSTKDKMNELKDDPAFSHLATSFLQSQYDDTQATLASKGITHVVVRRGVKAGVDSNLGVGDSGVLKMRPMSSWSTNPDTAKNFSGGKWVLQTKVPREKIVGFAGSGFGCLNEFEVVVIGGRTQARIVRKGNQGA